MKLSEAMRAAQDKYTKERQREYWLEYYTKNKERVDAVHNARRAHLRSLKQGVQE